MGIVELGALGEFVGSIAVLATLIYLSFQVREYELRRAQVFCTIATMQREASG